mmetsp:Transcript_30012/g.72835  ORF Transcript_30012/g.72835 Transcript_30012/m.72835 type:complete len:193 (+) Transcript_30012:223-801(+)
MSWIGMVLMPISQAASWYLIAFRPEESSSSSSSSSSRLLYEGLSMASVFYALWALFNVVVRKRPDLGVISMSILALASYYQKRTLTMVATFLVIVNYVLALFLVLGMLQKQLKSQSKQEDDKSPSSSSSSMKKIFPWVFLAYVVSNLILFSLTEYKLWKMGNDGVDSTGQKDSNHGGSSGGLYSSLSSNDEV